MPSSSSAASSTEHWIRTPGLATVAPIRQATALDGASASTGTVVSISRKPNAAAVAELGHRHGQLGRGEDRQDPRELGRGGAAREADHLGPRGEGIDE